MMLQVLLALTEMTPNCHAKKLTLPWIGIFFNCCRISSGGRVLDCRVGGPVSVPRTGTTLRVLK